MRNIRSNFAGFTLMELLLVMVILAIVAGIIAPSLRGFGIGRQTNDAATLIVALADYAQTQAISEGRPYRLNVDPASGAFWLSVDDNGTFVPPNNDYGQRFELAGGLQIQTDIPQQQDGQYIEFRPSGRTAPAHLTLTNQLGAQIEIASLSATEPFRILKPGTVTQ
jgi:type II secretion system protein H